MNTVTVSIGRNIGAVPMPEQSWADFTSDVESVLRLYCSTFFVSAAWSMGSWEGVEEESRTWVAELNSEGDEPDPADRLEKSLSFLATVYLQDAIALTVGSTVLAGALADV